MQSTQIQAGELTPLKDNELDFEGIAKQIKRIWKDYLYMPLVRELGASSKVLKNAKESLLEAIRTGRIEFYRGTFSGRFNSSISKELKLLGASWDRKTGTWKLSQSFVPMEVRNAISASKINFQTKVEAIDRRLAQVLPEEIADHLKISSHLDKTLWKVDRDFKASIGKVALAPELTESQVKTISDDWEKSVKLPIKDWTQKEVEKLRKRIQESVLEGNRRDSLIKIIKSSHETSLNKAKFIARQETRLLVTKFKETQYLDAGVNIYKWRCANRPHQAQGSRYKKGEVRHDHGILENKYFRWDHDFEVDQWGNKVAGGLQKPNGKDNPGQDFNCRCFAVPIVHFKKG